MSVDPGDPATYSEMYVENEANEAKSGYSIRSDSNPQYKASVTLQDKVNSNSVVDHQCSQRLQNMDSGNSRQ